ncbi:MAG: SRPBCC domain-containing protein [Candidatus Methanomethylicia archaeon]
MPTAESKITVKAKVEEIYGFLRDLRNIGRCLGVVEEINLVDGEAIWILKTQQARITRTREVRAKYITLEENKRIIWEAKGGNLYIHGEFIFKTNSEIEVNVKLTFEVLGPLGAILRPMISITIGSRLESLIQCLKENVEASHTLIHKPV